MKNKDINACIADLEVVARDASLEPEQRNELKKAIGRLRWLRRKPKPRQDQIFRVVRDVAEVLVRCLLKC